MRVPSGIQPTGELHIDNAGSWRQRSPISSGSGARIQVGRGCADGDKMLLADIMIEVLRPMRERAAELRKHTAELRRVLDEGREAAGAIAGETMAVVRSALGLWQASIRIPTA